MDNEKKRSNAEDKTRQYHKPEFRQYGHLASVTQSLMDKGSVDGGMLDMTSG